MREGPLVSVVVPAYNRPALLRRAISSVVHQTYKNIEIIIIDDSSEEDINSIVSSFNYKNIKYIRHKENQGGGAARNTGISHSSGEFIAFLDSDDQWLPQKVERQIEKFQSCPDEVGAVYCKHYDMDDTTGYINGPEINSEKESALPVGYHRGQVLDQLLKGWCPATTSLFMVKTEALKSVNAFDESLPSFQDYDLWIRIADDHQFEYVSERLIIKHKHSGRQLSTDPEYRTEGLKLFLDKWRDEFLTKIDTEELGEIFGTHLSEMYWEAAISNDMTRRERMENFVRYLTEEPQSLRRRLILFFCVIFLGRRPYDFAKSLHHMINWEPYTGTFPDIT